jgi:hypothetical protein
VPTHLTHTLVTKNRLDSLPPITVHIKPDCHNRIHQARPIHQDSHKEGAAALPVPRARERKSHFRNSQLRFIFAGGGKATVQKGNQ